MPEATLAQKRHAVSPEQKLMLLNKEIYFLTFLFLWYAWRADGKRKIVPRCPQSHGIALMP